MINRLQGIIYPPQQDQHMIDVPPLVEKNFDSDYPFLNKRKRFICLSYFISFFAMTIGGLLVKILLGVKVKGRKNYTKNKELFKNGVVTVCNHVHMWDSIVIMSALRYRKIYYPAWEENLKGKNRFLIRMSGGIPVTTNFRALKKMDEALNGVLQKKKILHFFPEGSMWWYYPTLRNYKKGAFKYAVKNHVSVLPLVFTFRPPKGIYRLFRKDPLLTLNILEPVISDDVEELRQKVVENSKGVINEKM